VLAADLQPRSAQAYGQICGRDDRRFLLASDQDSTTARRCDGVITARAANGDGILNVPDGLIHHWLGLAFVQGATLKSVVQVARDYSSYPRDVQIRRLVKGSVATGRRVSSVDPLKEDAGLTAVLDVRSAVEYRTQRDGSITAVSKSEEVRQVENFGKRNESLLPGCKDSGYLWRAHTLTHFVAEKDGVFIVMETLGAEPAVPHHLPAGIIDRFARRIGRKSVEGLPGRVSDRNSSIRGLPAPKAACD
jgi:hypothetical protein